MKLIACALFTILTSITLTAQPKKTSADDYRGTFQYAVAETNAAFPFVFTVVTKIFDNGKLTSTETEINERQAEGVERETKTLEKDGKTFRSYSVMVGFGNNTFCSSDGKTWKGPQEFVCSYAGGPTELLLGRRRTPETVEYTVAESSFEGKPVKIYRKYSIYPSSRPNGKKTLEEEIATLDSRGLFISVTDNEGTLDPNVVTFTQKQTWDFKTKFKPVIAPK